MPQLRSGRHVGFSADPYVDAVSHGSDEQKYATMLSLRLQVGSVEKLREQIFIVGFRIDQGTPPDAPRYLTGYTIGDVLAHRADWLDDEVEELREFVAANPRFQVWLHEQYDHLDAAIRQSPVWQSPLITDD